jgi:8-oxo-dGTP pyrophosphatase MutT (NUDIX family)
VGREAGVAVLLAPAPTGEAAVLLIQRTLRPTDPWSGHIGLPGGRREPDDEDLVATALRETEEEVAISVPRASLLCGLDPVQARHRGGLLDLMIHPNVFGLDEPLPPQPSCEVRAGRWIPLSVLADPLHATTHAAETPVGLRPSPAIRLDDWILWGLTYRMLGDLFLRLGGTLAAGPPT